MTTDDRRISRRQLVAALPAVAGLAAAVTAAPASAAAQRAAGTGGATAKNPFPADFLWGTSTSGHQVEGNNVNSDVWLAEHVKPTMYAEPSGDACDQYHRFREDIALMAKLGLNCYRLSLEWSRIEPEPGEFSMAELEHYRQVLAACQEAGVKPFVMYNHLTTPRWFAAMGGWENPKSPDLFARYCEKATQHLSDLIHIGATFNEPCLGGMFEWLGLRPVMHARMQDMFKAAARACGSDRFSMLMSMEQEKLVPQLLEAHRKGAEAMKSGRKRFPVGMTINIADDQSVGADSLVERKRREHYGPFLEAARQDDFIGVQNYGRLRYDSAGRVRPDKSDPEGDSFSPESLGVAVRYAAKVTGKPVYVSENGFGTDDDTRRVEFIRRAVTSLKQAIDDHVDVRSYVHWSFIDNYEWTSGYKEKMGLVEVDRKTQQRRVKPSGHYLGQIARNRGI